MTNTYVGDHGDLPIGARVTDPTTGEVYMVGTADYHEYRKRQLREQYEQARTRVVDPVTGEYRHDREPVTTPGVATDRTGVVLMVLLIVALSLVAGAGAGIMWYLSELVGASR